MANWDSLLWLAVQFSVLALVVERALYVLFEWSVWEHFEDRLERLVGVWFDLKPPLSAVASIYLVFVLNVDMVSSLFDNAAVLPGKVITGLFVAGGAKAVFLFWRRLRELRDARARAEIRVANNGD